MKFKKLNKKNKNAIVTKVNVARKTYRGEIFGIMGSRMGFVNCSELSKTFVISPDEMDLLFPNDVVDFSIVDREKNKIQIVGLVSSTLKRFTGEFYEDDSGAYVIPDVYGLNRKIRVPKSLIKYSESNGDFVSAEIIEHPFNSKKDRNKTAKASILGVISKMDSPSRESSYCIYKNDLPSRFSSELLAEVANIPSDFVKSRLDGRVDLRSMPFVSIDGSSAFDIDDAIYVERVSTGYRMYVSISDVSEFIPAASSINREVAERCSSVYLVGNYIPMLPSELSRLSSLDSFGDILAMTVEMNININGELTSYDIYESVISDNLKLSYDFVEDVVNGFSEPSKDGVLRFNGCEIKSEYMNSIFNLYNLHKDLISSRNDIFGDVDDGGFRMEIDNRTKTISNICRVEDKTSKSMVREAMLLTNSVVAKFIFENIGEGKKSIFVVRDGIKTNKIDELISIVRKKYNDFDSSDLNNIDGFNKVLSMFDKNAKEIILTNVKDSLYSNNYRGNFYRGLEQYTHFTSPLRRYPDILVHRLVKSILRGNSDSFELGINVERLNSKIKNIKKTEREVDNWLKYKYLNEFFNKSHLNARIISVSENVVNVRLIDSGIDGVIIANKHFKEEFRAVFDRNSYEIRSKKFGVLEALGTVKVVQKEFDFINKQIVFKIQLWFNWFGLVFIIVIEN